MVRHRTSPNRLDSIEPLPPSFQRLTAEDYASFVVEEAVQNAARRLTATFVHNDEVEYRGFGEMITFELPDSWAARKEA